MRNHDQRNSMDARGFSLLELIVVIGVIAVIAGIGSALFPWARFAVQGDVAALSSIVTTARTEALSRNTFVSLTFDEAAQTVVLAQAETASDGSLLVTPISVQRYGSDGRDGLSFDVANVDSSLEIRIDPRGVGQNLVVDGTESTSSYDVVVSHAQSTYTRTITLNRYGGVE